MTDLRLSRRGLIALVGASAVSAAALTACGGASGEERETDQFGEDDVGILNFALTLEHLEAALYAAAIESGFLAGPVLDTFREFGEEEERHVAALTKAVERMGGQPAPKPETEFPMKDRKAILELASQVENLGAAAYLGQISDFRSDSALELALSIHSVEGRHAAAINTLVGESITPDGALASAASVKDTMRSVEPFIVT